MNKEAIETIDYKGAKIFVEQDTDPSSPRTEYDNVGTMVAFREGYALGDEGHGFHYRDYSSWNELEEAICKAHEVAVILPLYLFDHSGITISTKPFSCPWDSGQVGFIFCTKGQVQKEWGGDVDKARDYLVGEVETYDQYLTGQIYGIRAEDAEGEELWSCWGFFGDGGKADGIEQAKQAIDEAINPVTQ